MSSAADRLEFGPPKNPASARAFGLALLAHILLIGALTWGVNWKSSEPAVTFEAELWSAVPQQAAPRLAEPPAPPPVKAAPPPSPPVTKQPEAKVTPPEPKVDIALEQEKKRKLLQQQKDAEILKEKKEQKELEARKEQKEQEKLKAEIQTKKEKEKEKEKQRELKAKEELAKRKAAEELKQAEAKKQDAKEFDRQQQQKQASAEAQKQRQAAMNRMMGLAGATGGDNAGGNALKSSGPSAGYGGRVKAKVLPNVVFTDDIAGNPTAEVEVRTTPDGSIISQRILKSSGNKAWDEAVIKAIIRTETMPRDVDGRVPTPLIIEFKPKG